MVYTYASITQAYCIISILEYNYIASLPLPHSNLLLSVPPSLPNNTRVVDMSSPTAVRVAWDLTNQTTDEAADEITLVLTFRDSSAAPERHVVSGGSTSAYVPVIPGQEYYLHLVVRNQDGTEETDQISFSKLPAGTYLRSTHLHEM